MRRTARVAAMLTCLCCLPALAAAQTASDPLADGTGRLVVTFQGPVLLLDLTLPAADIVGFEHAPQTDEHHTDIAQARTALLDPWQVVALPPAAGCASDRADADFVPAPEGGGGPATFNMLYELSCAAPERLTGLGLPLFRLYPALTALQVRLVAGTAHRDVTVTPAQPQLDLTR